MPSEGIVGDNRGLILKIKKKKCFVSKTKKLFLSKNFFSFQEN